MLSIPDMLVAGTAALLLFGPDQLPKVARKAGQVVRDLQNTSQSFIREMERAADLHETPAETMPYEDVVPAQLTAAPAYHETPLPAALAEADVAEPAPIWKQSGYDPYEEAETVARPAHEAHPSEAGQPAP